MDISGVGQSVALRNQHATEERIVEQKSSAESNADDMKSIKKAKLERQVMADPSLAQKLVATEATPTYNANGSVIQAVSTSLGDI